MNSRSRFAVSALMILAGGAVIWFLGWLVWELCNIWQYLQNYEYQHLLLLMVAAWIVAGLARTRHHSISESVDTPLIQEIDMQPKNNPHPIPNSSPELKALSAKVDELLEKQTDVHAIMRFFKAREQKDNLRRPVQKSEIKIEIPEEIAETLKPKSKKGQGKEGDSHA